MNYDILAPSVIVEAQGPVRIVTMNAPERLNSVDDELHGSLRRVWDLLMDDAEADAVVLTGAGRAFSAGGNMTFLRRNYNEPELRRHTIREAGRLMRAMMNCELPIVAAVNGPAVGLGATLAVTCDLVVISEDTYLCDPHVNIGVVAGDGGAASWPLLTSLLTAKEFLLLGDRISANDCLRLGFANRVVAADQVLSTALELAGRLAAQPKGAVRDTKRALNMHLRRAAEPVLDFALSAEWESLGSDDLLNTLERFEVKD